MSSKRAGLPSLNSSSKKEAPQPVKVQRYRAGKAPEGYVDPALESSDEEEGNDAITAARGGRGAAAGTGGISMSISSEPPKMAYQILNVEQMTRERQMEQSQRKGRAGGAQETPVAVATGGDRRLARLQAIQMEDRAGREDMRSRRRRGGSDNEDEEEEKSEEDDDEEEAALRRRKAARAKAMREEEEEELWEQGEEEEEEEQDSRRKGKARREGEESEGSSEYTSSGSEEESSEDEMVPRRKLMKPVFVPKSQRVTIDEASRAEVAAELAEKERIEALEERKKESHQILKEYVARQAAVEEVPDVDNLAEVDDTDGLDKEAEFEQWRLRELKRIKRDREELEAREAEKAEIERRRELTEEERVKEDMAYLAKKAKEEQAQKANGPVEKYHHKGAFFMDTDEAILKRPTNEATPDAIKDVKALPKIMQVRNFGRAGQTKYTTLKDQDTSQPSGWSDPATRHPQPRHRMAGFRGDDIRIASKMYGGRDAERGSGERRENANNTALGDRYKSSSSGRYDRDRDSRRRDDNSYSGGSHDYRDRDRGRDRHDRHRDHAGGNGSRYSGQSSSSYPDRDRDRGDDRESSKRRRH